VRRLRGLTPTEKAVAFVMADHEDQGAVRGSYPSMSTVAKESGLQGRETASRIVKRLVECKVIGSDLVSKGRKTTVYRFNLVRKRILACSCDPSCPYNRDCRVTVENSSTVRWESRLDGSNRDSGSPTTVTQNDSNRDPPVTRRVCEGLEGGAPLMQLSQDHRTTKLHEPVSNLSQIGEAIGKTVKRFDSSANGEQRSQLAGGIYRKKIGNAYFDATRAGMTPDECVREAITAGALTLVGNRSVQLRGLDHEDLARDVWERIRNGVAALNEVKNFEQRSRHVVAIITNCLTSVALEFWEQGCAEVSMAPSRAHGS
jgi:Helix-turn-helix domain